MNTVNSTLFNASEVIPSFNTHLKDSSKIGKLNTLVQQFIGTHEKHYLKEYSLQTDIDNINTLYNDVVTQSCVDLNTKSFAGNTPVFWSYWREPGGLYQVPHIFMKLHRLKRNYSAFSRRGEDGFVAGIRNLSNPVTVNAINKVSSLPGVNRVLYVNNEPNTGMSTVFMSLNARVLHAMSTPGSVINYYNNWKRHYFAWNGLGPEEHCDYKNPVFCVDLYQSEEECINEFNYFLENITTEFRGESDKRYTILCSYSKLAFASTLGDTFLLNLDDFQYYVYNQEKYLDVHSVESQYMFVNALSNAPFDRRLLPGTFLKYLPVVLDWFEGVKGEKNTEATRRDVVHLPVAPEEYTKIFTTLVHFASSSIMTNVKNIFVIDSLEDAIATVESTWEYYRHSSHTDPITTVSFAYPETPENLRVLEELSVRTGHQFTLVPLTDRLDVDENTVFFTCYDYYRTASIKKDTVRQMLVKVYLVASPNMENQISISLEMPHLIERVRTEEMEDCIVQTFIITEKTDTEIATHVINWYNEREKSLPSTPLEDLMSLQRLKASLELLSEDSVQTALMQQMTNFNIVSSEHAHDNMLYLDTEMPTNQRYSEVYNSINQYKSIIKLYHQVATGEIEYNEYTKHQINSVINELATDENNAFADVNKLLVDTFIDDIPEDNPYFGGLVPGIARFGSEKLFELIYDTLEVTEYCARVRETNTFTTARRLVASAIYQFELKHGRKYQTLTANLIETLIGKLYLTAGYYTIGKVLSEDPEKANGIYTFSSITAPHNIRLNDVITAYPRAYHGFKHPKEFSFEPWSSIEPLREILSFTALNKKTEMVGKTEVSSTKYLVSMKHPSDVDFSLVRPETINEYTDTPVFRTLEPSNKPVEAYTPVKPANYQHVDLFNGYSESILPKVYDYVEPSDELEEAVIVNHEPIEALDSDGNTRIVDSLPENPYMVSGELFTEYWRDGGSLGTLAICRRYDRIVDDIQKFEPEGTELSFFELLRKYDYPVDPLKGFEEYFEYSNSNSTNLFKIGDLEDIVLDEFSILITELGGINSESHADELMEQARKRVTDQYSAPKYLIRHDTVYQVKSSDAEISLKPNGLELIRNNFLSMFNINEKIDFESTVQDELLSRVAYDIKYHIIEECEKFIADATEEINTRAQRLKRYNHGIRTGVFFVDSPEDFESLPDRTPGDETWYQKRNGVLSVEVHEKFNQPVKQPVRRKFKNKALQTAYDALWEQDGIEELPENEQMEILHAAVECAKNPEPEPYDEAEDSKKILEAFYKVQVARRNADEQREIETYEVPDENEPEEPVVPTRKFNNPSLQRAYDRSIERDRLMSEEGFTFEQAEEVLLDNALLESKPTVEPDQTESSTPYDSNTADTDEQDDGLPPHVMAKIFARIKEAEEAEAQENNTDGTDGTDKSTDDLAMDKTDSTEDSIEESSSVHVEPDISDSTNSATSVSVLDTALDDIPSDIPGNILDDSLLDYSCTDRTLLENTECSNTLDTSDTSDDTSTNGTIDVDDCIDEFQDTQAISTHVHTLGTYIQEDYNTILPGDPESPAHTGENTMISPGAPPRLYKLERPDKSASGYRLGYIETCNENSSKKPMNPSGADPPNSALASIQGNTLHD